MSDGSAKPIEQVTLEDQVMAFDGLGALEPREVTDLFVHGKRQVLDVDGVQVTSEHPFLLADGSFRPVAELRAGDQIVRADGSLHTIEQIADVEGRHTVYNFTVEGLHTYVAADFRVHNKFVDPVILDLDGNGIQVTRLDQSTMFMDAGGDGLEHRTAWAASGDGVLFYDPDGRDAITEKRQFVFTEWDPTATSDMEALASVFDSNGDGVLSADDAAFAKFKLLVTNPDGSTSVKTLTELGITQINLTADATNIELSDGSVIAGQTTFTRADGTTGTVGDMKLAASDMGYRVEQVESVDGSGARTLIATAYESDGSKAYEIHSVTSADGLSITNRYDDNGDGVTNRIQSIVTVVGSDGSRTQTESNFAGSDMASAVLRSRTQTTTSADGNTLTIERDMTGGGWFDQREVRATQSDGSKAITISALAKDGSVITSRSETVSSDGSVRVDGHDQDGDGSADTTQTHSVTVNGDDSRSETIAITNQDGSLRSHVKEDVSADGRTKVVERDLDGDGDTDTREELSITVAADGQTTSELAVKNGDGSLRSSTTTVQSADALTKTTTADQDGDGDIDLTIVDTTTIAADGSREQVVTQTNADGSVRSKTRETLGADKVSQQTFVDLNQNGSLEANEVVSSVVSSSTTQDRIATSWTRNADGSVNAKTVATTSADGLRTTTHTDRDGDGDTDVSVQDITSIDGGGNSTRTLTTRNSDGSLRSQAKVSTSADGLSVTTTTDVDGDGQIDVRTIEVLAKETDGGTRQTRSDYAGDGSLISKQVVDESADRRVKTTSTDLDGDGNSDAVSIRTEQTDGSVSLQETSYANDGTALGQTLTTSSANGLTTSIARDLDGDLSADVTVTSETVLNADGSKTTSQESRNADGSLRSQSTVSVSDDGLQSITKTDDDGDGTFERSVKDTTVLKADGSTVRTSETRSDNGSLLSRTQASLSDDELSSVVKTDADGDGTYDLVKTTVAELQADGSLVTTVELRDGSGALRTRSVETVSDNERYRTSKVDVNGDGQVDQITTQTVAEDGQVTTSVRTQSKDGELQSESVTLTSANGLSVTEQFDQDGDGVYERRNETTRSLNDDGSQTTTTSLKGQDGTLLKHTVLEVSDDTLVSTRRDDLDGDGQSDRTTNTQRVLGADGSQTTTSSITAQNGSLLSKTVSTMSADERSSTRSVDMDGNGHQDEVVSTVIGDDGVTTSTMAYYSESGGLLAKTVQSKNGNGLENTTTFDLDGDGVTDRSISDVTVLSDDGSRTQTVTHMNGQGYTAARLETQTDDDGLSGQVRLDRDGNGIFETRSSFETDFASNGDVTRTTTTTDTGGSVVAKTTVTTSGDSLHVSETTDFNGDGTTNRSVDRELGASGGGTETLTLSADDGQKLYSTTTVTSADERSRTSTIDLDGDGVTDQKIETQLDLSGNQTTVHSQLREDGTAGTIVTQTTSANGHEQSYAFDLDGDGRADILRKTSISYDEAGNQVKVFEEKDGDTLKYTSTTVTSGNGLTATTTVDSNGDGETDTTTVDETILGTDGSTTFTSTERYEGGSLRSSYQEVTSADGRTVSKSYDFDGDGRKDKTEVTKTLADGSKTVTETAYSANGSAQKSFVTQTSSDGLTTTIVRDGITQTIARSVLNDGSYTWDNGVSASSSNEHIKVSHEIDAHGLETWRIEKTANGSTTVSLQRFDEAAKNRLLQEAAQIYDSVLDRKMDISEIEVLVQYADNSQLNHTALAQALLASDEYTTRYGTLSDAGFVARAYQNTLGREPELAELAEHLEDLNAGTFTRAQLSVDLARSVEHKVTGNNTGQTNNEDVFLFDLEKEEDLFASFGEEGPAIKTNDMEVKLGTDGADTLQIGSADAAFGGGGNDTITGGNSNDLLYGGKGNDTLNGGKGLDTLVGGQGNDTLKGGDSTDVLTGGEGNDRLEGGSGNDVYAYKRGDGKDTISDSSGSADVLVLSDLTLDDVTLRREGNDMIVYVLDKDNPDTPLADLDGSIRIQNWNSASKRIDTLRFGDGFEVKLSEIESTSATASEVSDNRVRLDGTSGNDFIVGTKTSNYINAGAGNDILDAGGYSSSWQHLQGKGGNDTYLIGADDGEIWITQYGENAGGGTDTVHFKNLSLSDLKITTYDHDDYGQALRFQWDKDGQSGSLFLSDLGKHIERFEFADGSITNGITIDSLGRVVLQGTSGNDIIVGGERSNIINAGDGNDRLEAGGYSKHYQHLRGQKGNDTYLIDNENNIVWITQEAEWSNSGYDTVIFKELTLNDLQFSYYTHGNYGQALRLQWDKDGQSGSLFLSDLGKHIERFQFADGNTVSSIRIDSIGRVVLQGTGGNDVIVGGERSNIINAGDGNDTLEAGGYSEHWQHLRGQKGNDTYLISNENKDVWITQEAEWSNSGYDTVIFKELTLNDLQFSYYTHGNYGQALRLQWDKDGQSGSLFLSDLGEHIERFQFADGRALSSLKIRADGRLELRGTDGNDFITGTDLDDFIYAGQGNDILDVGTGNGSWQHARGQSGNDTYLIAKNSGLTVIHEESHDGTDTIKFSDLLLSDISFEYANTESYGKALIATWDKDDPGKLQISFEGNNIERFQFADGVMLRAIKLNVDGADNYHGTDSDDVVTGIRANGYKALRLYGEKGNDTLIAANAKLPAGVTDSGSQHLYGREGNDTYVISKNSGDVRITGDAEEVGMGTDTIRFIDLTLAELTIGYATTDPASEWNGAWHFNWSGEAALLIQKEAEIEMFEFADGTTLSKIEVRADGSLKLTDTLGDDIIKGGNGDQQIIGRDGNDTIFGGDGNDQLYGGSGRDKLYGNDGNDTLNGYSSGSDYIDGGEGNDTVRYYWARSGGVSVNLQDKIGLTGDASGDVYVSIENVIGSNFGDDHLVGDDSANILNGYAGNDTLIGGNGNDTLIGGQGSDIFVFGNAHFGNDTIKDFEAGAGSDDVIHFDSAFFANFETVLAAASTNGSDTVISLDGNNSLTLKGIQVSELHTDDFQFI
ncbi:DUF4214 domain-containing protein [Pseudovibrio sp. FO-BEG1]|uniref:DUF4214 domain-containing protein n=1 Tax=Pseudovibrio sp. (strain FO-BEG1) TaxID=911045 RepID=UPI0002F7A803|nr:DUF4214 domain-containing protein [Pseudovibrio sp. FO-BEG1]